MGYRTDLVMEAYSLWKQDAGDTTKLPGVRAREEEADGVHITRVEILDRRGEQALGKPRGSYVTLELRELVRREPESFARAAQAVAKEAAAFLKAPGRVIAAGLGNEAVTPDALGPRAVEQMIITRHLKKQLPEVFSGFCSVAAVRPGVLATSGMESLELVRAAAGCVEADTVIVIDALAAASAQRICTTVQLSDAGLAPGSGIGNRRSAFTQQSLGRKVLAVGVPTLMDAGEMPEGAVRGLIVTPGDIDARVREMARVVGFGLNLALHPGLTIADVESFLA